MKETDNVCGTASALIPGLLIVDRDLQDLVIEKLLKLKPDTIADIVDIRIIEAELGKP